MPDVGDAVENVTDGLTRKVGPLPAWAWAGIVVAGVGATILIRRRYFPAAIPAEPGAVEDGGTMSDDWGGSLGFDGYLPGGFIVGGGPTGATGGTGGNLDLDPVDDGPTTNSEWGTLATRYLIGLGYSGAVVTDAVGRYLSGRTLTEQGRAMIDQALAKIGPPPLPVPPPTVSPAPEPTPSPGGGGTAPKPKPAPAPKPTAPRPTTINAPAKVTPKPAPKPKPKPKPTATRSPSQTSTKPPPPAPTTPDTIPITVGPGVTMYGQLHFIWGRPPTVAEIKRVAAMNNLNVGPAPAYQITPWYNGMTYQAPRNP